MVEVKDLRCEGYENPLGLDEKAPVLSWRVEADGRGRSQKAYAIQVATDAQFTRTVWERNRVAREDMQAVYAGRALMACTRYYWRVRVWDDRGEASSWSPAAWFETGLMEPSAWKGKWITADPARANKKTAPSPMMRRVVVLPAAPVRARLYITALGMVLARVNGRPVGPDVLLPGWSSYNKRVLYATYDVTDLMTEGENVLGAILGEGWYRGNLAWEKNRALYGHQRALLAQLHVECADGSRLTVVTDRQWKWDESPIRYSEIYHGEIYDARMEQPGWDSPGFSDKGWKTVRALRRSMQTVRARDGLPVRPIEEIRPVAVLTTPKGETVLDMGQNMVGWVRVRARGKAGDEIVLRHAEVLDRDGNVYLANLRKARQCCRYILKGEGEEVFAPHFTFQGFRYVRVDSYPGPVRAEDFTGVVVHSDMASIGSFSCDRPLVNQLQRNIRWGQRGNFVDIPTDCPQRDERLGWTGDAQVFIPTACYNFAVGPFFRKWLRDLAADQRADGGVPHVIPDVLPGANNHSSTAWGDAATICPWTLYRAYGDKKVLKDQYPSMKAWVDYMTAQGDNPLLYNTGFHFGDWVALDAGQGEYIGATNTDLIATAYYARSALLVGRTARLLGKKREGNAYIKLHNRIVEAFRHEFVTPSGRLVSRTQTAYALALCFDLLEEKDRPRAVNELVRLIDERNGHLSTGFVGTPVLCEALTRFGRHDVACRLVLNEDYPSWLYPITKGATTIWEHWDGIKPDGSFWSPAMNSFNHYSYGAIGDWLYRHIAGIDQVEDSAGYRHSLIRPLPGHGFSAARGTQMTPYGLLAVDWTLQDGRMTLSLTVPVGTVADVVLAGAAGAKVTEGGKSIAKAGGVSLLGERGADVLLRVGSGQYEFAWNMAAAG